jgi:hypothetical protein
MSDALRKFAVRGDAEGLNGLLAQGANPCSADVSLSKPYNHHGYT